MQQPYHYKGYGIIELEKVLFPYLKNDKEFTSPADMLNKHPFKKLENLMGYKAFIRKGSEKMNHGYILYIPDYVNLLSGNLSSEEQDKELEKTLSTILLHADIQMTKEFKPIQLIRKYAAPLNIYGNFTENTTLANRDSVISSKSEIIICPKCQGYGTVDERVNFYESDAVTCPHCKGQRVIVETTTVTHTRLTD